MKYIANTAVTVIEKCLNREEAIALRKQRRTEAFQNAISDGNTKQVKCILMSLSPNDQAQLLEETSPSYLIKAATSGNLAICIMILRAATPVRRLELLGIDTHPLTASCDILVSVAEVGQASILSLFLRVIDSATKQKVIQFDAYLKAFLRSIRNGHVETAELLLREIDPLQKEDRFKTIFNSYVTQLQEAICEGRTAIVALLLRELKPDNRSGAIKNYPCQLEKFYGFKVAVQNGYIGVVEILLRELNKEFKQSILKEILESNQNINKAVLPVLLAHADLVEIPYTPILSNLAINPHMPKIVSAYKSMINQEIYTGLAEISNQTAQLLKVCKNALTSMFLNLGAPLNNYMFTFLIPNMSSVPCVKQNIGPLYKFVEQVEETETKGPQL